MAAWPQGSTATIPGTWTDTGPLSGGVPGPPDWYIKFQQFTDSGYNPAGAVATASAPNGWDVSIDTQSAAVPPNTTPYNISVGIPASAPHGFYVIQFLQVTDHIYAPNPPNNRNRARAGGQFSVAYEWTVSPLTIHVPQGGMTPIGAITVSPPEDAGRTDTFLFTVYDGDPALFATPISTASISAPTSQTWAFAPQWFTNSNGTLFPVTKTRTIKQQAGLLIDSGPYVVTFIYAPSAPVTPPDSPPGGGTVPDDVPQVLSYCEDAQHAPAWVNRYEKLEETPTLYTTRDGGKTYQTETIPISGGGLSLLISGQSNVIVVLGNGWTATSGLSHTGRITKSGDTWDAQTLGDLSIGGWGTARAHPTDRQRVMMVYRNYSSDPAQEGTRLLTAVSHDGGNIFGGSFPLMGTGAGSLQDNVEQTFSTLDWVGEIAVICVETPFPFGDNTFVRFRSNDGGDTWTPTKDLVTGLAPDWAFHRLTSTVHHGSLYVAGMNRDYTKYRLIRSNDFGATWAYVTDLPDASPVGLGSSSRTGRLLWGLTYYSEDSGETWLHV